MVTGSLQGKNKMYYAVIRLPHGCGGKKQKWIQTGISTQGNTKRQANARLREIVTEFEAQRIVCSADILFVDWIKKWMEQKQGDVRTNTYESYQYNVDAHIIPYFSPLGLSLRTITPQHIQDYYNDKRRDGQSPNTIRKHNVIIGGALKEAVVKSLITFNPAERAKPPKKTKYISSFYTVQQANRLLETAVGDPIYPAIILGLFYGLRRSEALGLRWSDVDFDTGTIQIRNTVVRSKILIEHEETKSEASKRTLYIMPATLIYLRRLKRENAENRLLLGDVYQSNDHVCVWPNGRPLLPHYIPSRFATLLKRHGLPKIRFRELRHTAGHLLIDRKVAPKQIQEFLAHEKISTTFDIYGSLSVEGKRETSEAIDVALARAGS